MSTQINRHHDCDVLIIGSGAGGATTAATLAEAGHDVLIVEEGSWVPQGTVAPFSLEQMDRQYRSGGVTVALGLPSIAYTEGRCAGGGTEVNSGLYRRPPGSTLERWRQDYRIADFGDEDIGEICDEVERELSDRMVPTFAWGGGQPRDRYPYPAHIPAPRPRRVRSCVAAPTHWDGSRTRSPGG